MPAKDGLPFDSIRTRLLKIETAERRMNPLLTQNECTVDHVHLFNLLPACNTNTSPDRKDKNRSLTDDFPIEVLKSF